MFMLLQRGVRRVHLLQRGGNAHGHVHHCAERADDNAGDEQAPHFDDGADILHLHERFGVLQAEAVNLRDSLHGKAEKHRENHAGNGAEKGADRLSVHTAENREAHERDIGADGKRG